MEQDLQMDFLSSDQGLQGQICLDLLHSLLGQLMDLWEEGEHLQMMGLLAWVLEMDRGLLILSLDQGLQDPS